MDLYAVNMMPGTYVITHISLLHASIIAHAQDPFSQFDSITVRAHRLLRSLQTNDLGVEFTLRYHHFMMTGNPGWDEPSSRSGGWGYHHFGVVVEGGVRA